MSLLRLVVNENEPQPILFNGLLDLINILQNSLNAEDFLKQYAIFEFALLNICGFGLDLNKCVVTNATDNLAYISPKSGCAVSIDAGKPYHDKLFKLPKFLLDHKLNSSRAELFSSLEITKHFINKSYLLPHNLKMPFARTQLAQYIKVNLTSQAA